MASRAAIVSAIFVLLYALIVAKIPTRIKGSILFVLTILVVFIALNPQIQEEISKIITANKASEDISDISSGRTDVWEHFFKTFYDYIILGYGQYKMESFPLSVLYQYGLVLGLFFIGLAFYPLIVCKKYKKNKNYNKKAYLCCVMIFIAYIIDAIFEELAPFGPGVKCMALWLIVGILTLKPKNLTRGVDNDGK